MKQYFTILLLFILTGCGATEQYSSAFLAMGNIPVEITVYGRQEPPEELFREIKDTVRALDSTFSKYSNTSPLYMFNNSSIPLPSNIHTDSLIIYSERAKEITGGLFDIGIETLLSYYRRAEQRGSIDSDSIDYFTDILQNSELEKSEYGYVKDNDEYMIDFGGIAKGYFGEVIKRILARHGIKKAIINLAGDIVIFNVQDEVPFNVGVRDAEDGGIFTSISIVDDAVMTSGDYFRYYEIGNERYCHIVNPLTGRPHDRYRSVTVICQNGALCDALATAFMMADSIRINTLADSMGISVIFQ